MTKVMISKKYIISIEQFMENYLSIRYTGNSKLTHNEMNNYLLEKGRKIPVRESFKRVDKEKILTGNVIAVKDKNCQVIIYQNPINKSFESLLEELKSKTELKQLREQIVKKPVEKNIEEEEYQLKGNRYQKFLIRNHRLIKKRHY